MSDPVEAAAIAMREEYCRRVIGPENTLPWHQITEGTREHWRTLARVALAAAPQPEGGGWQPELVGADKVRSARKGDVTINVPTALCWLQFAPDTTTGKEDDTRPGVGFALVAYPEARGEWPVGVIPRSEAARLHRMLGEFLERHPPAAQSQESPAIGNGELDAGLNVTDQNKRGWKP